MEILQKKIKTVIGPLYLVATKTALRGIFFTEQDYSYVTSKSENEYFILKRTEEELQEYLAGKRKRFTVALEPIGTPFQKRVWAALAAIPYGETRSYRDIARAVNNLRAYRAVGTANGRNPLSLIIPCHRVIAADGTLGGYGGGLSIKEHLLNLEKIGSGPRC